MKLFQKLHILSILQRIPEVGEFEAVKQQVLENARSNISHKEQTVERLRTYNTQEYQSHKVKSLAIELNSLKEHLKTLLLELQVEPRNIEHAKDLVLACKEYVAKEKEFYKQKHEHESVHAQLQSILLLIHEEELRVEHAVDSPDQPDKTIHNRIHHLHEFKKKTNHILSRIYRVKQQLLHHEPKHESELYTQIVSEEKHLQQLILRIDMLKEHLHEFEIAILHDHQQEIVNIISKLQKHLSTKPYESREACEVFYGIVLGEENKPDEAKASNECLHHEHIPLPAHQYAHRVRNILQNGIKPSTRNLQESISGVRQIPHVFVSYTKPNTPIAVSWLPSQSLFVYKGEPLLFSKQRIKGNFRLHVGEFPDEHYGAEVKKLLAEYF